ncbi:MAG TPA: hypothetical protein VLN56_03470 [Gammaproteobacteria bacterium]|nr:hypothetical protein [Gammaproteobacteria bacterium]
MNNPISLFFLASFLVVSLVSCTSNKVPGNFWEIPDEQLPYIAMIRDDPRFGTAVIYNPLLCKEIGDACAFFRIHADAHIQLNHNILATPEDYPPSQEAAADCYAARNVHPHEVQATVALLSNEKRSAELPITGNPAERAERIQNCAIKAGNWIAGR